MNKQLDIEAVISRLPFRQYVGPRGTLTCKHNALQAKVDELYPPAYLSSRQSAWCEYAAEEGPVYRMSGGRGEAAYTPDQCRAILNRVRVNAGGVPHVHEVNQAAKERRLALKMLLPPLPPKAAQPVAAQETVPEAAGTAIALSVADIQTVAQVEVLDHVTLARNLGYGDKENAKNFREFVKGTLAKDPGFQHLGTLAEGSATVPGGNGAVNTRAVYYFTEEQALYATAKSHKPEAARLTLAMVKTFAAYRQGKLQPTEPSAGLVLGRMSEVVELLAKRLVAHDDRFQELVSVQEVERVRVTDLAARISRLEDGRLAEATPDNSNGKRVPSKYEAQCKHPRLRGPASPKQVQYVTSLGYVVPGLTKAQAHWLISNHYAA